MERLTIRKSDKHVDFISPIGTTFAASDLRAATIQVLLDRLDAYEDIGLLPEEVAAMVEKERREAVELAELCGGISGGYVEHIRELLRTEQDGRMVVLPCKVGDTVYVPRGTGRLEPWEMIVYALTLGKDGKVYICARDKRHCVFQGNFIMGENCFKYREAALKEC